MRQLKSLSCQVSTRAFMILSMLALSGNGLRSQLGLYSEFLDSSALDRWRKMPSLRLRTMMMRLNLKQLRGCVTRKPEVISNKMMWDGGNASHDVPKYDQDQLAAGIWVRNAGRNCLDCTRLDRYCPAWARFRRHAA